MILSGGLIVLSDFPSLQLAVALICAIGFHQIHALWKPHSSKLGYYLQHVALTAVELVYLSGLLLLLKEPVPDALLVGASGGTVFLGFIMMTIAMYMALKKFIGLRKQDRKDEREEQFRKNLSLKIGEHKQLNGIEKAEKFWKAEKEASKGVEDANNSIASTKVMPQIMENDNNVLPAGNVSSNDDSNHQTK